MKKTFLELREIDQVVGLMYQKSPELRESKFGYGYKRFNEKNYAPLTKEFNTAIEEVRIDNALTEPTTLAVLKDKEDVRGFKYNKEGLKKVARDEEKVVEEWNKKEFTIVPHYVKKEDLPKLTPEQKEALTGILIEESKKSGK